MKRTRAIGHDEQSIALQRRSRFFPQTAGVLASALGGLVLIGWWLNSETLRSIVPGSSPLKPNIAAGLLLCGAVLALLSREKIDKWLRCALGAVALAVILMALATLGGHFLNWDLGIDRWLVHDFPASMGAVNPGRMQPTTAFCFVLMGAALLAEAQFIPRRFRFPLVAGLSAALVLIGVLALGGFSLEKLFGPRWNLLGMSLSGITASVGFMILGSGLLALLQSQGALAWSLNASTTVGFAVGIFLTVLTTASAFTFGKQMLETNNLVGQRQDVLKKIQEVMTDMVDLASRERVYLITGNEQLLKEREQTKTEVREDFLEVRKLTSDNPGQQRRLDQLEPLIAQRIDWEEQMIALRRAAGFAAAADLVATGRGLGLSDDILRLLKERQNEEYGLLDHDKKRAEMASTATFLLLPLGVFVSLGVLSLSLFFLNAGVSEQKWADTALRESEEGMRAVLESALDSIITMDHQGRVVAFNPAAEKTFGYRRSDVTGQFLTDLIIPASLREAHRRGLSHYLATGEGPVLGKRIEMTAMRSDGSEFPVELAITRIGSREPPMFTGFIRDITERKRAEEMVRESEERYRQLFESNPNPMWVFDLETLSFLAVNDAAVRHYGYSRDEFLAMTIKDIRPPEDIPALMDNVSQTKEGLDDTTQWRHRKKDGALIDVEITSHEVPWLGRRAALVLINDVTERRRAEQVRAQLAAIVESSDDAIISKTLAGVITSWNLGAEKLFDYSAEEAIGKPMGMLFPPDRAREEPEILARIRRGETVDHFDTVRMRKDGKPIDVSVALSPIRDGRGKIIGASTIARDISERKRAENEILQLNIDLEERVERRTADLEAANKELEAFSYSVSHDLRAPLRAVDGFSQAVLEDYGAKLPEEGRRYLQTIREGAQRMGVLIDDLLTFSRLSRLPLHKQAVNMSRMVRQTFEELSPEKQGRKVDMNIGELATVHGDPALLKQVWVNLLSNALKYTRKRETAVIGIGCKHQNGADVYFVSDNGTGFDMQYAHKLFGVFQRLHRADEFEGTGVGLAIVQRVVHRHGGRVWAEAEVDRGATFYFTLEGNNNV
jgi:PAS domain S-box-containing protein